MNESENATGEVEVKNDVVGKFRESLLRNNDTIRKDRAETIFEAAEICYRRKIEDYIQSYKNISRIRENSLDLSPTDANSLVLSKDFDSQEYVDNDMKLTIDLYNLKLKIEFSMKRYEYLFGRDDNLSSKLTEIQ